MKSLNIFTLLLLFPLWMFAQVDLSFFPYYNAELMEDINVSKVQLAEIETLNEQTSIKRQALHDALLYREDLEKELKVVEVERLATLENILTAEQKQAYQFFKEDAKNEVAINHSKRYKDMYLGLYDYLDITGEQAQQLADFELSYNGKEYKTQKKALLKDILSEKQWKKYERKRTKEHFQVEQTSASLATIKAFDERQKNYLERLKELYIPQRAALRTQLDSEISEKDLADINYLRTLYEDKIRPMTLGNCSEVIALDLKEIIHQKYYVANIVQQDRATFNIAKRLAIKFDQGIDLLQAELIALNNILEERTSDIENNTRTEKVELNRNIAFLLIKTDPASTQLMNIHQVSAFPLPAQTTQTLSFRIAKRGLVTIDLLDAQGKLVKTILEDKLSEGTHQQSFDLSDLPENVFFYRITSEEGKSLMKSLKVNQ